MSHCNDMICQPVTLSGYAEWPKVADAVIEACLSILMLLSYNFYCSPSYVGRWSHTHVEAIASFVKEIPKTASVCTTYNIIPHLTLQRHLFLTL